MDTMLEESQRLQIERQTILAGFRQDLETSRPFSAR